MLNRILPLTLLLGAAPLALAAPQPTPLRSADPAALAMVDRSAKAYGALRGFTVVFSTAEAVGSDRSNFQGTLAYEKPGKVRLEVKAGAQKLLCICDGKQVYSQNAPTTYHVKPVWEGDALGSVLTHLPSPLILFLPDLVLGRNPLTAHKLEGIGYAVQIQRLAGNGVRITSRLRKESEPQSISCYFDPKSHLLNRIEGLASHGGDKITDLTVLTKVKVNPAFAAGTFVFKAPAGAKVAPE